MTKNPFPREEQLWQRKKSFSSRLKGKIRGQILQLPSAFSFLLEPLSVLFLLFSDVVTVLWNDFCQPKKNPGISENLLFQLQFFFATVQDNC